MDDCPELPLEYTCTSCHNHFKGEPIGEQGVLEISRESYEQSTLPKRNCYFILVCEECADIMFKKIDLTESTEGSQQCH